MSTPIKTEGGEVGIPADKASDYYKTALAAAENVLKTVLIFCGSASGQ